MILNKTFNRQLLTFIQRTTLLLCLVITVGNVYSQQRTKDIRRVIVTTRYVLKDGKSNGESWAVYQEIFDSQGRLHTEIEYDFMDHRPYSFIWHTFSGKQKVKTEIFRKEKLNTIKDFKYDNDSLLSQEVIKSIKPGDTSVLILSYQYNKLKKPILVIAKNSIGKSAYKSKSTYDNNGTELSRSVNCKSGYCPLDSVVKLTSKPQYDSLGRLSSNLVTVQKINGPRIVKNYRYTYDKKSNIIGITILDDKGKQISREERIYHETRNRISQLKFYDANDNIKVWLGKRYEIYPTNDHRDMQIEY